MDAQSSVARVIVADDNVDLAESLAGLLRSELPPETDIVITHDGLEVLEEVSKTRRPVAVVLDMDMPGMSGLEAASAIRRTSPCAMDTVLVAVSGDENLLDCARRSGHFRMIQRKPIDLATLLRLLKSLEKPQRTA
jgi:two-component system response regulator DesR